MSISLLEQVCFVFFGVFTFYGGVKVVRALFFRDKEDIDEEDDSSERSDSSNDSSDDSSNDSEDSFSSEYERSSEARATEGSNECKQREHDQTIANAERDNFSSDSEDSFSSEHEQPTDRPKVANKVSSVKRDGGASERSSECKSSIEQSDSEDSFSSEHEQSSEASSDSENILIEHKQIPEKNNVKLDPMNYTNMSIDDHATFTKEFLFDDNASKLKSKYPPIECESDSDDNSEDELFSAEKFNYKNISTGKTKISREGKIFQFLNRNPIRKKRKIDTGKDSQSRKKFQSSNDRNK